MPQNGSRSSPNLHHQNRKTEAQDVKTVGGTKKVPPRLSLSVATERYLKLSRILLGGCQTQEPMLIAQRSA